MSILGRQRGLTGDWRTALRLGRVSNLPTVWSNVLAGAVLAGADPTTALLAVPLLAASLLYVGGMYLNDAFDAELDARERPGRPIPAGLAGQGAVFRAGYVMLGAGVALLSVAGWLAGLVGLALAGLIIDYDRHHKANPLSPVVMGLCRSMVYLAAGLALAGELTAASWQGATVLLAYLIGLTYAAKQEHLNELAGAWPLAFLAAPFGYGVLLLAPGADWLAVSLFVGFLAWVLRALGFLLRTPRAVPKAVVALIAGISLLDALLCAAHGAPVAAVACVAAFTLTLALQRFVPGT